MATKRRQITFVIAEDDAARIRMLAEQSAREVRSIALFALAHAASELRTNPAVAWDFAALAKSKTKTAPFNFALTSDVQAAIDEVAALVDDATQMMFLNTTTLRASLSSWLASHTDEALLSRLGVPAIQTA